MKYFNAISSPITRVETFFYKGLTNEKDDGHAVERILWETVAGNNYDPQNIFEGVNRKSPITKQHEEVSDGIIISQNTALMIQSKARTVDTQLRKSKDEATGDEHKYITEKYEHALKQAVGSIDSLKARPALMKNLKGDKVLLDGNNYNWISVVIYKHNNLKPNYTVLNNSTYPMVFIDPNEWQALWRHANNNSASVMSYIKYIAREPDHVYGEESKRFFDFLKHNLLTMNFGTNFPLGLMEIKENALSTLMHYSNSKEIEYKVDEMFHSLGANKLITGQQEIDAIFKINHQKEAVSYNIKGHKGILNLRISPFIDEKNKLFLMKNSSDIAKINNMPCFGISIQYDASSPFDAYSLDACFIDL